MGRTRKAFIVAISAAGAGLALARAGEAKPAKAASTLARAYAARMRSFDPKLTDAQLDDIAHQMDQTYELRRTLRPKHQGLSNGDAPSPQFEAGK